MDRPSILKFGGAACASAKHFAKVADLVVEAGAPVVVVVSAMQGMTDSLTNLATSVHERPPAREMDMLLSVGERISMSLLAMALAKRGVQAVSLTGSQSGIITSSDHTYARIIDVRPKRTIEALERGQVVIVGGFQGVSLEKEITTLGRGGSDTTAVALGAALGSPSVTFYKDVPGFFDADPKTSLEATVFEHLSFDAAYERARSGARVLEPRSIALAKENGIELFVRGLESESGTRIGSGPRKAAIMFEQNLSGCYGDQKETFVK